MEMSRSVKITTFLQETFNEGSVLTIQSKPCYREILKSLGSGSSPPEKTILSPTPETTLHSVTANLETRLKQFETNKNSNYFYCK